jgi:tetratricopeptide (TPR) repeat protein
MLDDESPREESGLKRWLRLIFGLGPMIISFYLLKRALGRLETESMSDGVLDLLMAVGLLIVAGIALAPKIAELITTPVRDWIDRLYSGGSGGEVVPELQPAWKLARKYTAEERWEEAIETLQRIITYYPKERDAYGMGIEAARSAGDAEAMQWFTEAYRKQYGAGR